MRVITCASYYGTGSSAVTDYVTEFSTVKSLGDSEIRILHDMDGVSDLQYHLTENHNRHNSGHAIKRFKKLVDFYSGNRLTHRYEPFFQNRWKEISYRYIDSLVDFSYRQNAAQSRGGSWIFWTGASAIMTGSRCSANFTS